jgi:hypothetical protein
VTQYIDEPYLSGILSSVLLGLAVLWLLVGINHLWTRRLARHAEGLPFAVRPVGVRARLLGVGQWRGQRLQVTLLGGPRGERARVTLGGREHRLELRDRGLLEQLEDLMDADKGRPARE